MTATAIAKRCAVRDEMQEHVANVVDLAPHRNRKSALAFAAKVLGLPFGRVRSLYYGEARRIEAHEADQVRAYVKAAEKLMGARAEYERKRVEFLAANPTMAKWAPGPLPELKNALRAVAPAKVTTEEQILQAGRQIAEWSGEK